MVQAAYETTDEDVAFWRSVIEFLHDAVEREEDEDEDEEEDGGSSPLPADAVEELQAEVIAEVIPDPEAVYTRVKKKRLMFGESRGSGKSRWTSTWPFGQGEALGSLQFSRPRSPIWGRLDYERSLGSCTCPTFRKCPLISIRRTAPISGFGCT